jgi:hypothetical protein
MREDPEWWGFNGSDSKPRNHLQQTEGGSYIGYSQP